MNRQWDEGEYQPGAKPKKKKTGSAVSERRRLDPGQTAPQMTSTGFIPPGAGMMTGKTAIIEMTGARSTDKTAFRQAEGLSQFQFSDVHHSRIIGYAKDDKPVCILTEVQRAYHQETHHEGAVGQWNSEHPDNPYKK